MLIQSDLLNRYAKTLDCLNCFELAATLIECVEQRIQLGRPDDTDNQRTIRELDGDLAKAIDGLRQAVNAVPQPELPDPLTIPGMAAVVHCGTWANGHEAVLAAAGGLVAQSQWGADHRLHKRLTAIMAESVGHRMNGLAMRTRLKQELASAISRIPTTELKASAVAPAAPMSTVLFEQHPHKTLAEPSKKDLAAYHLVVTMGHKQTEAAEMLTKQLREPVEQYAISRGVNRVKKFREAGGVMPDLAPLAHKPQALDPAEIDKGHRTDGLTHRQHRHAEGAA